MCAAAPLAHVICPCLASFLTIACYRTFVLFFFFNDTATTEIYTLSLHDALPIWRMRMINPQKREYINYSCSSWSEREMENHNDQPLKKENTSTTLVLHGQSMRWRMRMINPQKREYINYSCSSWSEHEMENENDQSPKKKKK